MHHHNHVGTCTTTTTTATTNDQQHLGVVAVAFVRRNDCIGNNKQTNKDRPLSY
jgi:hypothetical protein